MEIKSIICKVFGHKKDDIIGMKEYKGSIYIGTKKGIFKMDEKKEEQFFCSRCENSV